MECENSPQSTSPINCCDCDCISVVMKKSLSTTCLRSVKRKYDEFEEENRFSIPGFIIPQNARVDIGNECTVLREMVRNQQQTIQDLISELEEERNAASSAANEAMSMILRLQRDKAEIQMEARQFKRFAEEKMAHDQEEALILEDLLYKREEVIQSLTCEVQAYRHRMMSYGLTETEADGDGGMSQNNSMIDNFEGRFEFPPYEIYPSLKCNLNGSQALPNVEDEAPDIEKYAFGETPHPSDQLKDLEYRINQLEKSPRTIHPDGEFISAKNVLEKVIVGHSPRAQMHVRKFSADPTSSPFSVTKEMSARYSPKFGSSFKKTEFSYIEEKTDLGKMENASEVGDDSSDRVYTIDSVHPGASVNGLMSSKASVGIDGDLEIQKLYARLQALEADRESMRQAIISIGTEKAQVVLLKEIAQNLCKEVSPPRRMPVRKQSVFGSFSFLSIFKWFIPFLFWRKKVHRCKLVSAFGPKTSYGTVEMYNGDEQVKPVWSALFLSLLSVIIFFLKALLPMIIDMDTKHRCFSVWLMLVRMFYRSAVGLGVWFSCVAFSSPVF